MQNRSTVSILASIAGLAFALITGCGGLQTSKLQIGTSLSGNWSFAPQSSAVSLNLGFTQGAYENVSAIARLNGVSCVTPTTDIYFTGSVTVGNQMTLISSPVGGTTVTIKGNVTPDGTEIGGATWSFVGGSCSALGTANVNATSYSGIDGTYTGTFVDTSGEKLAVTALLEQTTQPDENGQFSLSGTATFPNNDCFVQQPTMTDSLVTGSSLSMTYVDPGSGATLIASGTFNSAATQLTITSWSIAGGACNGDSGTGSLTQ